MKKIIETCLKLDDGIYHWSARKILRVDGYLDDVKDVVPPVLTKDEIAQAVEYIQSEHLSKSDDWLSINNIIEDAITETVDMEAVAKRCRTDRPNLKLVK